MTLTDFLLARIAEDEELMREDFLPLHPWFAARILGGCEAKREIVTDFMRWDLLAKRGDMAAMGTAAGLRNACLRLAAIYKDHPDFDEVWLP